jgi:predicted 3-demethylubiquinone-9 3-methyltransferase (glyoxalase superfamily)
LDNSMTLIAAERIKLLTSSCSLKGASIMCIRMQHMCVMHRSAFGTIMHCDQQSAEFTE